ncbi:MAG: hypothetical protein M3N38_03380, partial [Pseudomonadota bacterium]|nr:hypothetical protein [Pseudomonadota bacterium]
IRCAWPCIKFPFCSLEISHPAVAVDEMLVTKLGNFRFPDLRKIKPQFVDPQPIWGGAHRPLRDRAIHIQR